MAVKLGMDFIKYTLLLISFMYLLTAAVLATIGGTVMERFSMKYFFEDEFIVVGKMIFFTGLILLFISLLGVIGSSKESTLLVNIFGCLIVVVLAIEVLSVIVINKVKNEAIDAFDYLYETGMEHYYEDKDIQESFDFLQSTFACCGRESFTEWMEMPSEMNPDSKIPESCCSKWGQIEVADDFEINSTMAVAPCQQYYVVGCMGRMSTFLNKKSTTMGLLAIILAQFVGVLLVFTLANSIRNAKTVREMQRWQVREQMAAQRVQNHQKEDIHPKGILIPTTEDSNA